MKMIQALPIFSPRPRASVGEGARRADEGSLSTQRKFVEIAFRFGEEPSSGLRPPSPMLRTGEGKVEVCA